MLRIVSQSIDVSHSRFSETPPFLLTAPHIAGLLPARTATAAADPAKAARYVFDRPALADLSASEQDRLFDAANMLLDIAVGFMTVRFNEAALRAAEVHFHNAVGGTPDQAYGPQAYRARRDAELIDWWSRTSAHRNTIGH